LRARSPLVAASGGGGAEVYTIPENHLNCAVGAYVHNIALSPAREKETEQTLKMMFDLGNVKPEEVPQIPRLAKSPKAIVYSPLADAPVDPDVVLFALRPAAGGRGDALRRGGGACGSLGGIGRRWRDRRVWRCGIMSRGRREELSHSEFDGR